MKCPECVKVGERSTMQSLGGSTTLMGWAPHWDKDGASHSHDPNRHTSRYHCSRGHHWAESFLVRCTNCNYGKE